MAAALGTGDGVNDTLATHAVRASCGAAAVMKAVNSWSRDAVVTMRNCVAPGGTPS